MAQTDEKLADEELAFAYLTGCWKRGAGKRKIFERAGAEEERGRQALARLLRSGGRVRPSILLALASLIDPSRQTFQSEEIVIRRRGHRREGDDARDVEMARHIVERRSQGASENVAVEEAVEIYGASAPTARRAYKKYRAMWERARIIK